MVSSVLSCLKMWKIFTCKSILNILSILRPYTLVQCVLYLYFLLIIINNIINYLQIASCNRLKLSWKEALSLLSFSSQIKDSASLYGLWPRECWWTRIRRKRREERARGEVFSRISCCGRTRERSPAGEREIFDLYYVHYTMYMYVYLLYFFFNFGNKYIILCVKFNLHLLLKLQV